MDRPIDNSKKKRKNAILISTAVLVVMISIALFLILFPAGTISVNKEKLTTSIVTNNDFREYIRINGNIETAVSISILALESGRIESIYVEEGDVLKKGEIILTLKNEEINMSFTDEASSYTFLTNELNNQLIEVKQQEITDKQDLLNLDNDISEKKRKLEKTEILFNKGGVSEDEYLTLKNSYETAIKNRELKKEKMVLDAELRKNKKVKIELEMKIIKQRLENLNIKAPADGQLSDFNLNLGEAVSKGSSIGKINILDNYKVTSNIDEYYIDKIKVNQTGIFENNNSKYELRVSKIYSQVVEGMFKTEFCFKSEIPQNIKSGQNYNISLQLGQEGKALQIPKGSFFQTTGGNWIYVLGKNKKTAEKRKIKIGRQNPLNYEIIEGLENGEEVIVSGYELTKNKEKIKIK